MFRPPCSQHFFVTDRIIILKKYIRIIFFRKCYKLYTTNLLLVLCYVRIVLKLK